MFKRKHIEELKARIKEKVEETGGLTRKQIAYAIGEHPCSRDFCSALDSLATEKAIARTGSNGSGYRYWSAALLQQTETHSHETPVPAGANC